ncbi:MAG: hypothetical protein UY09_C0012G0039 [Parcubacteria group bacterium GW2011_GWA2_47_8]|nr:MAG: hypothetical protein UY09_C0012G0039 [Parcubacteria group bacterium GW2011_GWA2_47_8]
MHLEAIKSDSRSLFEKLSRFEGFYLAGGTALALQIGHRISIDFDLFSSKPLLTDLLATAEKVFSQSIAPSVNNESELTFIVAGTKVTFLYYPFPILLELVQTEFLPLLSVPEIAATKAYTVGRRASLKDYVDLYFIMNEGHSDLKQIIDLAIQKYSSAFDAKLFLEQLVYLKDVATEPIEFIKSAVISQDIELYFQTKIRESGLI